MTAPLNTTRKPPYKLAGLILSLLTIAAIVLVYFQFRGDFLDRDKLTMMSARAGLSMDPGAKVTYNGVDIGRVGNVQVDPIKLNQTLSGTAEALGGLGDRFGQSIVQGNDILADINPQMSEIRRLNQGLASLGDVYANAAPDLFDGLEHAVTTARTLNEQQRNIDQALMAAVGFGNTGGDIFERGGPYLVPGPEGLPPTSQLLPTHT